MLGRWHAGHFDEGCARIPKSNRTMIVRVPGLSNPTSNSPSHAGTFVQVDDRSAAAVVSTVQHCSAM
jgi:hypothetical protein